MRKGCGPRPDDLKARSIGRQRVWVAASVIWKPSEGLISSNLAAEPYGRLIAVLLLVDVI